MTLPAVTSLTLEFLSSLDMHAATDDDTDPKRVNFWLCNWEFEMSLAGLNELYHFSYPWIPVYVARIPREGATGEQDYSVRDVLRFLTFKSLLQICSPGFSTYFFLSGESDGVIRHTEFFFP